MAAMTLKRSAKLAIQLMRQEMRALAFEANMYDVAHVTHVPSFVAAARRRAELKEAIAVQQTLLSGQAR